MGELKESKLCPKRERCIHGAECVHQDTFRGEHLCFENKNTNVYERMRNDYKSKEIAMERKCKDCIALAWYGCTVTKCEGPLVIFNGNKKIKDADRPGLYALMARFFREDFEDEQARKGD